VAWEAVRGQLGRQQRNVIAKLLQLGPNVPLVHLALKVQRRELITQFRELLPQVVAFSFKLCRVLPQGLRLDLKETLLVRHVIEAFLESLTAGQQLQQTVFHARDLLTVVG